MPRVAAGPPLIRPVRPIARCTDVGRAPNPYDPIRSLNDQREPNHDDILTFGGGGPEAVPIATRHAHPPDAAEQED